MQRVWTKRLTGRGHAAKLAALALAASITAGGASVGQADDSGNRDGQAAQVRHVVVIYQENVSFDHYFGTYPFAANPAGEPRFSAAADTPTVNGLTEALLTNNPNAANPRRLSRSQAVTCDMDHGYSNEQKAFNHGLMDKFVEFASGGRCTDRTQVMNHYDGNTVTALWNYAQNFAMSDNSYSTNFGPSTVGALNLIAGQTHGATPAEIPNEVHNGTVIGDPRPAFDDCSKGAAIAMSGRNVGNLLSDKGLTWGWFQGGFRPTSTAIDGKAVCGSTHKNIAGATVNDYIPHHQPFQYYASTANPHHVPPASVAEVGHAGPANHQYDLSDFWAAADAGNVPAVSFLKAAGYQDGHAGYSNPLDEQTFLVQTINRLQRLPSWSETVVFIAYDDSDGWYDHVMGPIVSQSNDGLYDALSAPGACGVARAGAYQNRCGYGPRQPLLTISPFAQRNFVDSSTSDQSSMLRFIEDTFNLGRLGDQSTDATAGSLATMLDLRRAPNNRLFLDPSTGQPQSDSSNDQSPTQR